MAKKTDEIKLLETRAAVIETFIQVATEDQLRSILSSLFSSISSDLISNKKFPGMYESDEEHAASSAKEDLREDIFNDFKAWVLRSGKSQ